MAGIFFILLTGVVWVVIDAIGSSLLVCRL